MLIRLKIINEPKDAGKLRKFRDVGWNFFLYTRIKSMANDVKINGTDYLAFEEPVAEIDRQIAELTKLGSAKGIDYSAEIRKLQQEQVGSLRRIYSELTAWQTVQVARHPKRPLLGEYLGNMVKDFRELHGDRAFRR